MARSPEPVSRRAFVRAAASSVAGGALLPSLPRAEVPAGARQATGVKVGEVTDSAAVAWLRLTAHAAPNAAGESLVTPSRPLPAGVALDSLRGACPGAAGRVRLVYGTREDLRGATATDWAEVGPDRDCTHQFRLADLRPATVYHYAAETAGPDGTAHAPLRGRFETAPPADAWADVNFTVLTCQGYQDLDHPDGFHIYPAMLRLRPKFVVPNGDLVYYDNDGPLVNSVAVARHHWHRMYGLPRHVAFHLQVPGYFTKDDHDCYHNDCWPGRNNAAMRPFTFEQGLGVFREQVPQSPLPYRTFRWGRGVQVWLVEGRDFRSPNNAPDGPNKTIWGAEQKRWLLESLRASDAVFKVLVSPTPIVGPDRPNKRDNHANDGFRHEGDEVRAWLQENLPERFAVVCGDRHWQYHSVHPRTRVQEYSCGAASDQHAGGSPGLNRDYHRFHRVRGGFFSAAFTRAGGENRLDLRLHDVTGEVVYQQQMRG